MLLTRLPETLVSHSVTLVYRSRGSRPNCGVWDPRTESNHCFHPIATCHDSYLTILDTCYTSLSKPSSLRGWQNEYQFSGWWKV